MSGSVAPERWYLTGPLGVGTAFDEPTDANSANNALSASWAGVGSAVRHNAPETLNLLDGRPGVVNQGPGLSLWGLNGAGKAVRLGLITSRFAATGDGAAAGYLALHTKAPGGDVVEALRVTERGHLGIGTSAPENAENWNRVVDVLGAGHAKLSVRTAGVDGRLQVHDNGYWGAPPGMIVGTRTAHALSLATAGVTRLRLGPTGDVDVVSPGQMTLTIGAGANGTLKVRHVNGKHWQNDGNDALYLNYSTGHNVHVGGGSAPSTLLVSGDVQLDAGRTLRAPGRLHIAGDEILFLLNRNGVIVGRGWGGNGNLVVEGDAAVANRLQVGGEAQVNGRLLLNAPRTWITGFDGGSANGYHWIKTIDDENHMWMGFVMAGGIPNRIELGPPLHGTFHGTLYGTVRNPSDARIKSDVRELSGVLGRLDSVRGVSFVRHQSHPTGVPVPDPARGAPATEDAPARREIGVIAQEVEAVFPELVTSVPGADVKAVDYAGLTGVLVEAVRALRDEQRDEQQDVRRRLVALEARLAAPPPADGEA